MKQVVADNTPKPQRLGDCIGKGAFGSVYKAFNWGTGEAVAVKQIKIADVPKSELRMIEVNNHPPTHPLTHTRHVQGCGIIHWEDSTPQRREC